MTRRAPKGRSRPVRAGVHVALVVDDNERALRAAVDILLGLDYTTVGVGSQAEAFDQLARWAEEGRRPCVVLLDLEIPIYADGETRIENGKLTLRRLGAEHRGVPVIMITGHGDVDVAIECMKLGAVDYAMKPLRTLGQKVLAAVEAGCAREHPAGCPNVGPRARRAPPAADAQPRLLLDGTPAALRYRVVLDGREAWLREVQFRALCKLAAAARLGRGVFKGDLGSGEANHNVVPRLRGELADQTGLPRAVIDALVVTEGHGTYRLAVPPDRIGVNAPAMRANFAALLQQLGG